MACRGSACISPHKKQASLLDRRVKADGPARRHNGEKACKENGEGTALARACNGRAEPLAACPAREGNGRGGVPRTADIKNQAPL